MRHPYLPTAALLLLLASPTLASWPVSGIVVGDALYSRSPGFVYVVSDGGHGVIVHTHLWHETSRVDPQGTVVWSVNPFTAAKLPEPTLYTVIPYAIAGDGAGGVWFATQDTSRNLVAAHLDAGGALEGGIVILSESRTGAPHVHVAVPDGAGGMFVVWSDVVTPDDDDLRATHVDASGDVTGPTNGVVVFGGPGVQAFGGAVTDGVGGLLVMTHQVGAATVQRLDAGLAPKYGAGGRVGAPAAIGEFSLAAAGDGGAFVAWPDGPGTAARVRIQRLDASGLVMPGWPAEGASAALPPRHPSAVHVVADGRGGACVAWLDQHEGQGNVPEVRVSRVLANGQIARGWQPAGVIAGGGLQPSFYLMNSVLVADGTGGCYIAWPDVALLNGEAYAQHVAADGRIFPGWPAGGLPLGSDSRNFEKTYALSDGAGGVYVAWDQYDYPSRYRKVRLTRLSPGGPEGGPPTLRQPLSLARVAPNPASGLFTVSVTMPDDRLARLEVFDLGGRIGHAREVRGAGEHGLSLDGSGLAPGVHWMRLTHPAGVRTARIVVLR